MAQTSAYSVIQQDQPNYRPALTAAGGSRPGSFGSQTVTTGFAVAAPSTGTSVQSYSDGGPGSSNLHDNVVSSTYFQPRSAQQWAAYNARFPTVGTMEAESSPSNSQRSLGALNPDIPSSQLQGRQSMQHTLSLSQNDHRISVFSQNARDSQHQNMFDQDNDINERGRPADDPNSGFGSFGASHHNHNAFETARNSSGQDFDRPATAPTRVYQQMNHLETQQARLPNPRVPFPTPSASSYGSTPVGASVPARSENARISSQFVSTLDTQTLQDIDRLIPNRALPFGASSKPERTENSTSVAERRAADFVQQPSVLDRSPLPQPTYEGQASRPPHSSAPKRLAPPHKRPRLSQDSSFAVHDEDQQLEVQHQTNTSEQVEAEDLRCTERPPNSGTRLKSLRDSERNRRTSDWRNGENVSPSNVTQGSFTREDLAAYSSKPVGQRREQLEQLLLSYFDDENFHTLCEDIEASAGRMAFGR